MRQKGFLDRVLQFMGIHEEEEPEEAPLPNPEPQQPQVRNSAALPVANATDPNKKKGRLVSLPGPNRGGAQVRVSLVHPRSYEEVEQIADHLKDRQPVIVSLDGVDKAVSRRIIDFVSGTTYALDGTVHRIGEGIFLFAPIHVTIDADIARTWQGEELFS